MKKTFTPHPRHGNARVFISLLISFVILVTPIIPLRAAPAHGPKPSSAGAPLPPPPPAATTLSATKTDSFPDPNNDGKAEAGDTITYDVNVSNTGLSDATGVTFTDTIDPNTTLVGGSLKVSPLAFADSYGVTVDTPLSVAAPGVLANDTGLPAPTAVPIAAGPTTAGGTVTLNANGSFSYNPPSGFTGADSFTYTATNGFSPDDTATVTLNVDVGPSVTTTSPTNGAINVAQNTNITVNFSESVNATASSFLLECPTGSPQAFSLSASPANSFTLDPSADLPAGTTCTVTVVANQITDADTFDPPDQMAADYVFSFGVKPLAVDDMHSATGNVRINTAGSGFSVLTNDSGPGVSITAFDSTSVHGGNITMNLSNGTFTYDPPRGFTGTDSFNYTISNAAGSDTGTVVLTVTDTVWFINNTAPACAAAVCGRLTSPYNSLADFEAVNGNGTVIGGAVVDPEAGDHIFIYTGSGSYTAPLTLENNQRVIGQGATSSIETLAGFTLAPDSDALPSTGGTAPVITSPGVGFSLAANNHLYGLAFSNTTGTAVISTVNVGTFVMGDVTINNSATDGAGIDLNDGGTSVTSTGVNTINTRSATALSLTNATNIGATNLTFRSISAGNNTADADPVSGIVLNNTGTSGGLVVTGNSAGQCGGLVTVNALGTPATVGAPNLADCTGGTVQNTTGDGLSLINTRNVSLTRMNITGNKGSGVFGDDLTNFSLISSRVGNNTDVTGGTEAGLRFNKLLGASAITNSAIVSNYYDNIRMTPSSGVLTNLAISGTTIGPNDPVVGNNGLTLVTSGTASATVTITNSAFPTNRASGFLASATGSNQLTALVGDTSFTDGNIGVDLGHAATGAMTFNVSRNTFIGNDSNVINFSSASTSTNAGLIQGKIDNNRIGNGALDSGSRDAFGIAIDAIGDANAVISVTNNVIRNTEREGIFAESAFDADADAERALFDLTLRDNDAGTPDDNGAFPFGFTYGTRVEARTTSILCMDMNSNNVTGTVGGAEEFQLRQRNTAIFKLERLTDGDGTPNEVITNMLTVEAFIVAQNDAPTTADATNQTAGVTGFTEAANGDCRKPTVPVVRNINPFDGGASSVELAVNSSMKTEAVPATAAANDVETNHASAPAGEVVRPSAFWLAKTTAAQPQSAHGNSSAASANFVASSPMPSGETVTHTVGTLQTGKTVHIQFQVTVDSPFTGVQQQVSNQGTVSGDNFPSVLTDDPTVGGSADPTVTPILSPPDITIKDASVAEPSSGSAPAAFAVILSHSFSQTVTVNFTTAPDTGGANPATAGSDYTTTSGTLTFNPGEVIQTISVPVLSDADNAETAETFLVNLSGATNGSITDGQAVGTITAGGTPGTVVISELRSSGPAGAGDDFVELLNNTDADITVAASDASAGWSIVKAGGDCSATPVIIAVIPNGTVIPARGNYLLAGSAYSLSAYGAPDQTLAADIEDDRNVALFNTADLGNLQTSTRLDAVGFGTNTGNNCDLVREGATLQPASGSTSEYSFVRKVDRGETLDTNDNSADFQVVSTTPSVAVGANASPTLGAPGPENSASPRGPVPCNVPGTAKFDRSRLDSTVGLGSAPNTVRDNTSDPPNNSTYGTLDFRRRFTNSTGGAVTRLRFRIVNLSTFPVAGTADLRARTSSGITVAGVNDAVTCNGSTPCTVAVDGTTLETPPAQALGGGVNSTLAAGAITLGAPLASGASTNLHFLFGVEQEGDYQIGIVIETLTAGSIGQDVWVLRGNTQTGGHTEGGCNTPPVANAGADQTVECAGNSTAVTLDGTASFDPDGDTPLAYEWREGVTVLGTTATLNTSFAFGPHTVTLKVTDPSGDFTEDTVSISVVDTANPMITPPPNVNVNTGPDATSCGAYVSDEALGEASATDGCATTVTVNRTGVPAGNNFPVGQTIITYTADDGHGHTSMAQQVVTVTDDTPPVINVPPDQTVNAPANSCSATVNPGTATATDNCPGVTVAGVRSDSQPLNAPYPVGVTTITWTATDASTDPYNNTASGVQTITVKDATAPTITLTTNTINLSPPNHQYQTFSVSAFVASVSDLCDPSVDINDVVISQVTSDEPEDANGNGDGNTLNDMVITPDCKSVQLRSERSGNGDGRVYTITLKVKDSSGNVSTAVRKVFVQNSGAAVDSGVNYTVNGCNP